MSYPVSAHAVHRHVASLGRALGKEFRDSRIERTAARYLVGLLAEPTAGRLKSTAELARLASSRLGEPVSSQSLHHLLHDAQWSPELMCEAVASRVVPELRGVSYLLIAMRAPRLGERGIRPRDLEFGTTQMVATLHAVGQPAGALGDMEVLPLRAELSLEGDAWHQLSGEQLAQRGVEQDDLVDHISEVGELLRREVMRWGLPSGPVVAGPSFSRLRGRWHRVGVQYVVEAPAVELEQVEQLLKQGTLKLAEPAGGDRGVVASMRRFVGRSDALVEVSDGADHVRHLWTNYASADEAAALAQQRMPARMAPLYAELRSRLGLDDYAGRSIRGWRRHRALVTAAQGFLIKRRERAGYLPG